MSDDQAAGKARLDAVMVRMLGSLLLLGAALLLGLTLPLFWLPTLPGSDGSLLALPGLGGRHAISVLAIPALAAGALLLGLPGLLALVFGRSFVGLGWATPVGRRPRPWRRPAFILLSGIAMLGLVMLRR